MKLSTSSFKQKGKLLHFSVLQLINLVSFSEAADDLNESKHAVANDCIHYLRKLYNNIYETY